LKKREEKRKGEKKDFNVQNPIEFWLKQERYEEQVGLSTTFRLWIAPQQ